VRLCATTSTRRIEMVPLDCPSSLVAPLQDAVGVIVVGCVNAMLFGGQDKQAAAATSVRLAGRYDSTP